ncbi:MAG: Gx transporter family protein, partial [Fibrobacterota bacterium]|nr:Gx transporter family protein [Fibrobacterota bacterium]
MPSPFEASAHAAIPDPERELRSGWGNTKVTPEAFALALLVASSFQIMENLLPRIPLFPWMRMGFSYVVILPFLLHYGPRAAFALFLARNFITVLYGGQPLTTFLIGSGSGALALLGLGQPVAWAYRRGWMGILGSSILLAAGFNLIQLAMVNFAFIRHSGFFFQVGPILAWSLISGAIIA